MLKLTVTALTCLWLVVANLAYAESPPFVFQEVTRTAGILPAAENIRGHAAGWGDVNGDGWLDLYIGTFHNGATQPNLLLINREGKFSLDSQPALRVSARANSALFVDLDNDGDLDLYAASMPGPANSSLAQKEGHAIVGCSLFRNEGNGRFTNISKGNGACPAAFGGRSATALDFNGDGLLDLLVGEDPLPGYNGSATRSSRLFRNDGQLTFTDVTQAVGIPAGIPGLGVVAADFNNDRWPDIFLACHGGGNVLLLNDGHGKFTEPPSMRDTFVWKDAKGDNMVCGVVAGDVNRDGLLDLVLGQHYDSPWKTPVANRLYLNRGLSQGVPQFAEVTQQVGLVPLAMKAPHVELEDFDNDGWPDLYTSIVKFAGEQPHPVIFRHEGLQDGVPRFREHAWGVNDFPNTEDRAIKRSAQLFEKVLRDQRIMYAAAGPSADYDRDGRLDLFLASWWPEAPSRLLRNVTPGGHWLDVEVRGGEQLNRQGVGARVNIYPAGQLGQPQALLGAREIGLGYGYVSSHAAIAHFGLGTAKEVDIEVLLPHGGGKRERRAVAANQRVVID